MHTGQSSCAIRRFACGIPSSKRLGMAAGIAARTSTMARHSARNRTMPARLIRWCNRGPSWPAPIRHDLAPPCKPSTTVWCRATTISCGSSGLPFDHTELQPGYIKGYVPGIRENGGQYTHAAIWVIQAAAMLGDGERAMQLFDMLNPLRHADSAEKMKVYHVEPYVVAADVYSLELAHGPRRLDVVYGACRMDVPRGFGTYPGIPNPRR